MPEIVIEETKLAQNQLTSKIKVPYKFRKYLKTNEYFAIYDANIESDKSFLNIPPLATILPLAWLTGSDILVDKLDRGFKESADKVMQVFSQIYQTRFTTQIIVEELIDNQPKKLETGNNTALLFSGGADSTYSLISNIDLRPKNIMIWGVDGYPYPKHSAYWEKVYTTYKNYLEERGLVFYTIKSNPLEILHERRIEHKYHKVLQDGVLWARIQHSLILLPITAPLSVNHFNTLLIASSTYPEFPRELFPYGSEPFIDEQITWSGVTVKHDGYIPKEEKIFTLIKNHYQSDQLILRVCMNREKAPISFNCGNCEKCYRTIIPLLLAGVDPNKCGFTFDASSFEKLKRFIMEEKFPPVDLLLWEPLQSHAEKVFKQSYSPEVADFFKWFAIQELKRQDFDNFRNIYYDLPFPLAKLLDEVYTIIGINIHDPAPLPSTQAYRNESVIRDQNTSMNSER